MALTLNGTTNTIAGLAVGGVPDGTIDTDALAANAVTAAKRGTGAILQVVNTTEGESKTITCSSAWVDSTLTCAITPAATSSKILLSMSGTGEGNAANQEHFGYRIKRVISGGATSYLVGDTAGGRTLLTGLTGDLSDDSGNSASSFSISNYLDSPSTTSAVTYTVQFTYQNAAAAGTFYLNREVTDTDASANSRYISWITLMEVAG
tara:strand:+ start:40 stop:660 length:621 start_codon:yes stop_codon:yes gene_type:complete